jgi:RNA polymerase sigma-70 factor (ECF subfamily)
MRVFSSWSHQLLIPVGEGRKVKQTGVRVAVVALIGVAALFVGYVAAGGLSGADAIGRYQLEAAIQAVHAARRVTGRTDWSALVTLYDALALVSASPAVAVSRAVALAAIEGPLVALGELDRIAADKRLADYQPYWATRAKLFADLGEGDVARAAYDRAIGLERDPAVRGFLTARRDVA